MIIFGWGRKKVKKFGPKRAYHCTHCNSDGYWELVQISFWFTLFFIPIFPYKSIKILTCPVCGAYIELTAEEFETLKNTNVSKENLDYSGKTETQINYMKQMKELQEEKKNSAVQETEQTVKEKPAEASQGTVLVKENSEDIYSKAHENIDKQEASVLLRLFAALIDYALIVVPLLLISIEQETLNLIAVLFLFVILVVQPTLLSILGQTIGKKVFGIKIVKVSNGKNGGFVTNVLLRSILNSILSLTAIYAIVDAIFITREDKRCIHDLIAGTKVIKA